MMEKVLLIGIDGVYNYGCEAIVRGTVEILKAVNPKIEVTYASYNFEDDRKRLSDCDIKILPRPKRRRWSWYNIVRKCLSYLHIPYVVPYDKLDWVVGFDTVFSIGGDIYTLASNGSYNASLPLFLEQLQQRGIKYILWGASVGKFEENHLALRFFSHHLSKINLIVSRESNTWEYLQSLNLNANLCLAPDPAFLVKNPVNLVPEQHEGIIIGGIIVGGGALFMYMLRAHTYLGDDPAACVNCHIMSPYYATWFHSSHARDATCNDCHVPHENIVKKWTFKGMDGMKHVAAFLTKSEPQVIQAHEASSQVIMNNCIRCHTQLNTEFVKTGKIDYMMSMVGEGKACWDCHRDVPHGGKNSLSATPAAIVPLPESPVPEWLRKMVNNKE